MYIILGHIIHIILLLLLESIVVNFIGSWLATETNDIKEYNFFQDSAPHPVMGFQPKSSHISAHETASTEGNEKQTKTGEQNHDVCMMWGSGC